MTEESTAGNEQQTRSRPTGVIRPTQEHAARALTALERQRITDADRHIRVIPESSMTDRTWKLLLSALAAVERGRLGEAEPLLLEASALAFIDDLNNRAIPRPTPSTRQDAGESSADMTRDSSAGPDALRLASYALHHLGRVYRRREQIEEARRAHLAAYRLRERHGSFEELWEAATQLGLDHNVARCFDEGRRWHLLALEAARQASDEPMRRQAITWTNLSISYTQSSRHDDAVSAARTARDCWRRYDIAAVDAARADLRLGAALLKKGEALYESGDQLAQPVLNEAVDWLTAAHQALLAFGGDHVAEAELCLEQKEFADRLLSCAGTHGMEQHSRRT